MTSEATIEPVSPAQARQARRLVHEVLSEFGFTPTPSGQDADLEDLPNSYRRRQGEFFVLVMAGVVVGTLGLWPHEPRVVELRKMYLSSAARGRGLGRRLLSHALDWARRHDYERVILETDSVFEQARALYAAHGFEPTPPWDGCSACDQAMSLSLKSLE